MIARMLLVGVSAASILAGCVSTTAPTAEPAELSTKSQEKLSRFEATGEIRTCLPSRRVRNIDALSEDLFLVQVGANDYYLNRSMGTCEQATRDSSTLRYRIDGVPNLCVGETINVVSNRSGSSGIVLGGCALGEFEKVEEKQAK